jgi:ABC-type nitrate/sulfonate/bicarbonate transport system permease component
MMAQQKRGSRLLGVGFIFLLLAMVELADATGHGNSVLTPPPTRIAARLAEIILSGSFVQPLAQTLALLLLAYAIACPLAVAVGLLMGRLRWIHDLLEPLLEMLRPLPKVALLPPLMLLLGLDTAFKVTIVALGVFFPVVINTIQGARGVDRTLVDCARTFGRGGGVILWSVILPAAAPMILAGMRVGLGLALILVVLAEMLAGTGGLGYLIVDMQRSFRIVDMYAWIVLLALLGYGLNAVFVALERRFVVW